MSEAAATVVPASAEGVVLEMEVARAPAKALGREPAMELALAMAWELAAAASRQPPLRQRR